MAFKLLGGGSDINTVTSDMNQNILELKNQEVTKFFKDDTGTRRVLLGKGSDGFYGMKVSEPDIDVYTATDDQLLFHSDQGVRYLTSFSTPFSVTSTASYGTTTVTITHGLGYVPITDNVINVTTNDWTSGDIGLFPAPYLSMATSGGIRGAAAYVIVKQVTSTTIKYELGITGGTFTLDGSITCYIKQSNE